MHRIALSHFLTLELVWVHILPFPFALWIMADDGHFYYRRRHHNKKSEPMTVPPGLGMETVTLPVNCNTCIINRYGIIVVKSICEQFLLFSAVLKYYEESEELQNATIGASRE